MAVTDEETIHVSATTAMEPLRPGETYRDYFVRIGGTLDSDCDELLDAMTRIQEDWTRVPGGRSKLGDSTEFIRRDRAEREELVSN